MRRLTAVFVLLFTSLACSTGPEPITIRHGSRSGTPPLTISAQIVVQGGSELPFRLISPGDHCVVDGTEHGTEAARTIDSSNSPGVDTMDIEAPEGVVGEATCEMYESGFVKVRF